MCDVEGLRVDKLSYFNEEATIETVKTSTQKSPLQATVKIG